MKAKKKLKWLEEIGRWEADALGNRCNDARVLLFVHGLISERESKRIVNRLNKEVKEAKIAKAMEEILKDV